MDIPNAFIQTKVEDPNERIILVARGLAAEITCEIAPNVYNKFIKITKGQPVLYLECMNVIYGTLKEALLFYNKFTTNMKNYSFNINPYDCCVANKIVNGKQLTAVWYEDDSKPIHEEKAVLEHLFEHLRGEGDDAEIGTIKVKWGPKHDFLGMFLS